LVFCIFDYNHSDWSEVSFCFAFSLWPSMYL
jgi:hypothetical protein